MFEEFLILSFSRKIECERVVKEKRIREFGERVKDPRWPL